MSNDTLRIGDLLWVIVEQLGHLLFPFRTINPRPPVEARFRLPRQPDLPRVLGQEIHFLETLIHREPPRAVADNHHVVGPLHNRFRKTGHILDALYRSDTSRAPCWTVHDTGIQFHYAFFIRQPAVAHGIVVRIIFDHRHGCDYRLERVSTGFQDVHALRQRVQAIRRGNNYRAFRRRVGRNREGTNWQRFSKQTSATSKRAAPKRSRKESTTAPKIHEGLLKLGKVSRGTLVQKGKSRKFKVRSRGGIPHSLDSVRRGGSINP